MATFDVRDDRSWFITQRWQQFEGEARANLLRIIAIATFYVIHLWNYYGGQGKLGNVGVLQLGAVGEVDRRFHMMITLLALAWILLAVAILLCLRSSFFPNWLPTLSTLGDALFLTSVLGISTGPRSPLLVAYFLVIVLASLRFDLRLVRVATVASMVGYVCLLGLAKWPERFGLDPTIERMVPRYQEFIFLAALALTGIFLGQLVRRVRRMAEDYAGRAITSDKAPT
jgi:hypothetical protein